MKAATWLVITLAFALLLTACGSADNKPLSDGSPDQAAGTPAAASITPEEALNKYASELVAENAADFSGHEPAVMTSSGRPLTYVLTFHTKGPNYLTKDISDGDTAGYEANLKITNRWQAVYCTSKLKRVMQSHGIFSAGAHVVGTGGRKHSIAICTV